MINKKLKRESGNCLIRAPRRRPWKPVQLLSMCGHEEALRAMLERGASTEGISCFIGPRLICAPCIFCHRKSLATPYVCQQNEAS